MVIKKITYFDNLFVGTYYTFIFLFVNKDMKKITSKKSRPRYYNSMKKKCKKNVFFFLSKIDLRLIIIVMWTKMEHEGVEDTNLGYSLLP